MPANIALVGIGKIAHDQHIPAIDNNPDWTLAATVSRNAAIDGVENYTNIDSLLASRPDIDTISLAIPTLPRFEYASKALQAGRHVMLEKPPGASVAECLRLEQLAEQQGVSLYATWHSRYADGISAARIWLSERRLKRFTINWKEDVRVWHPDQEWIWDPSGLGVFDPGINALSIMTEILSVPVHIIKATLDTPSNRQTPIAARLQFYHPDGAVVEANFDWRQTEEPLWQLVIETDDDHIELSFGASSLCLEYKRLYQRMSEHRSHGSIDMDLAPLIHVADACMLGRRVEVEPFYF